MSSNNEKVEFGNISLGLQRQSSQRELMIQQQNTDALQERMKMKLLNQRLQTQSNDNPIRTDLSTAEGLQLQENKSDEKKHKFDKLKDTQGSTHINEFNQKNKYIQINILAKSKQAVKDHIINNNLPQQSPAQDAAVRELLDSFQTQFNFRTAIDAKRRGRQKISKQNILKHSSLKIYQPKIKQSTSTMGKTNLLVLQIEMIDSSTPELNQK